MLLSAENFLSNETVKALCWTLVHSLWQGLLLAGIAALVILFTRKSKTTTRYNLLTATFIAFVLTSACTFLLEINKPAAIEIAKASPVKIINDPTVATPLLQTENYLNTNSGLSTINHFFNEYAAVIVLCWFLIIGMRCIKLGMGLYGIQQIKKKQTSTVGSYWSMRVQHLAANMNIKGQVHFLQSGIIKVPMVIGHLKPIIFFPLGALTALSPEDVEAILMHELAHIRRRDYIVNMLQHFIEILFFFNPAVLWVSSLMKTERENCCDDIALAQTSSKKNYIQALISFQEFDATLPVYATALTGKKGHLLQRVKRIVHNSNKSLSGMEKTFLIICFLLTGTLTLVFSQKNKPVANHVTSIQTVTKATAAERIDSKIVTEKKPTFSEDDLKSKVDSPPVKSIDQHITNAVQAEIKYNIDRAIADSIAAKVNDQQQINVNRNINTNINSNVNTNINQNANTNIHTKVEATSTTQNTKYRILTGLSYSTSYSGRADDKTADADNKTGHADDLNARNMDVQALTEDFIADLTNEKLITKREGLSYQLSSESLIINGKIQPESIHQKLKNKYIKSPDWKLMYNWKMK